MVTSTCVRRFERPTPWSVAKCSIQLSYTHKIINKICRRPESNRYGRLVPQDFKSCASASSATPACLHIIEYKWDQQGSNLWPPAFKAGALPAELWSHIKIFKRPKWDSNPRPPPWQGGALTNWAIGPY